MVETATPLIIQHDLHLASRVHQAEYSVWLHHPTGYRMAVISDFVKLEYSRAVNQAGAIKLVLPPTFDRTLIQVDSWLAVWRRITSLEYLDTETIYFVRGIKPILRSDGQELFEVSGVSALELLGRRVIAYEAGTSFTQKAGATDNIIKAIIRENLGSTATDSNRNLSTYLSVQADLGQGPSASKSFTRRNVLQTAQEIAQDSIQAGSAVYFDVVMSGGSSLEFRTYRGVRGIDHTAPSGLNPVILSPNFGNLTDVERAYDYTDETTFVYAGGLGSGSSREIATACAITRIGISPFNRREVLADGRQAASTNELQNEARAALRQSRPYRTFTATLVNTPATAYGLHWGFGDAATAEFDNEIVNVTIDAVTVTVEGGKETIRVELRTVESD